MEEGKAYENDLRKVRRKRRNGKKECGERGENEKEISEKGEEGKKRRRNGEKCVGRGEVMRKYCWRYDDREKRTIRQAKTGKELDGEKN